MTLQVCRSGLYGAALAASLLFLSACDTSGLESDRLTPLPQDARQRGPVQFLGDSYDVVLVARGEGANESGEVVAQILGESGSRRDVVLATVEPETGVVDYQVGEFASSRDGQTFVYSLFGVRSAPSEAGMELRTVRSDGTGGRVLAVAGESPFAEARNLMPVDVSDDGQQVLLQVIASQPGTEATITFSAVLDLATGNVTRYPYGTTALAFAPGGIVAVIYDEAAVASRFVLLDPSGGERAVAPDGTWPAQIARATFSRDGRFVAYNQSAGTGTRSRPFVRDLTTGQDTPIAEAGPMAMANLITPDGSRVLYTVEVPRPTTPRYELYVVGRDGTGRRRLVGDLSYVNAMAVSADGSRVLLYTNNGGQIQNYRLRLDS